MPTDSDDDRQKLIEIRTKLGLTQTEMAHAIGMKLRAYSDIETGNTECRTIHLMAAERVTLKLAGERHDESIIANAVMRDFLLAGRDVISALAMAEPLLVNALISSAADRGQALTQEVGKALSHLKSARSVGRGVPR